MIFFGKGFGEKCIKNSILVKKTHLPVILVE